MNKSSVSPRSPRFTPRKSPRQSTRMMDSVPISPAKKKENFSQNYVSISGQNAHNLPIQARSKSVVALNLENNQLSIQSLSDIPKGITSLSLRHNPLRSCQVPNLLRLRSLILDNCGITSFEGLPPLPRLRLLSVANNSITDFNHLPILPHLESFNISGNSFDFDVVTSIAAIGSISINKFNGSSISAADLTAAFTFSPLVGYSLRNGRTPERFESPEQEIEEAQKYLSAPLFKYLEDSDVSPEDSRLRTEESEKEEINLVLPFVAENIQWYRDILTEEKGGEWLSVTSFADKEMPNILKLTNVMKMHIIRCDFTMNNQKFTLYTDQPIGREPEDLCLPFPLDPILSGIPIEGSLISLIPLPIPVRVAWVSGSQIVLEDSTSIILSNKEIGQPITCLMAPYCPNYKSITFSVLHTETEIVGALLPTVSGIQFPENIIQDEDIKFERYINPDREGSSEIRMERALSQTANWEEVKTIDPEDLHYTPVEKDIDCYLRMVYTPLTKEGVRGETAIFYSKTKVVPTLPRFDNPTICGIVRAGSPVVAFGNYIGGKRGNCQYIWYMSDKPIECKQKVLRKLEPVCTEREFDIPEDAAGMYLAVEFIPIRDDEVIGDSVFAVSDGPISSPSTKSKKERFVYEEDIVAGKKINIDKSVYFFVTKPGADDGFEAVSHGTSWMPRAANVGQIVKVESPTLEGILGEVMPSPSYIKEISLSYDSISIGQPLHLIIKTHNLKAKDIEVIWIRCKGDLERAIAFNTNQYVITDKDIGFQIKARITQFDRNGNRMPYTETELTPAVRETASTPIIAGNFVEGGTLSIDCSQEVSEVKWQHNMKGAWKEIGTSQTYKLKKSDIGRNIRAVCIINGRSITTTAHKAVDSALPTGTVDLPQNAPQEGVSYSPKFNYSGGTEGPILTIWERNDDEDWTEVATNVKSYKPKKADVGHEMRIIYTPQRKDRVIGEDVIVTTPAVIAAKPKAINTKLIQNKEGYLEVQCKYSGGEEGESIVEWHAILPEGGDVVIATTTDKIIAPHPDLSGVQVYAIFLPTRSDDVKGDAVATNEITVEARPVVTSVEIVGMNGVIAPGNLLRVKYTLNKQAKARFQWYKVTEEEEIPIKNATDSEYTPTDDDGEFFIGCSVTAVDRNGWVSDPLMDVSSVPVADPKTKILLLNEEGDELGDTITTGTEIFPAVIVANVETDEYEIVWQRNSKKDKKKWIDISEEKSFCPTINEVGLKIRAVVGEDVSCEKSIALPKSVASFVKAVVRSNSLKMKCSSRAGISTWNVAIKADGITMKSKSGKVKTAKWATVKVEAVDETRDEMKLVLDPSTSFVFTPTLDDARIESNIGKENTRDFVVAVIRNYTQQ